MKRHFGQTKAARQAEWLAQFNDAVTTANPALSGRIEWASALHYYHSGAPVNEAVDQYLLARNIEPRTC
jgi:hypothetical protein